jgi:hypothetical protein
MIWTDLRIAQMRMEYGNFSAYNKLKSLHYTIIKSVEFGTGAVTSYLISFHALWSFW